MTIEGIEQYMSVELGERMRTVSSSDLMRKFSQPFEQVQSAMKNFVQSSNCIDNVFVAVSERDGSMGTKIRIVRLNELENKSDGNWWYYLVKPGNESIATSWSREVEYMREKTSESAPGLWQGASAYAGIVSDLSVKERQVQVRVETAPAASINTTKPTLSSTQNLSSAPSKNKLGFTKTSGPLSAPKEEKKSEAKPSPVVAQKTSQAKYQVPLDSLGGDVPGTPERATSESPNEETDVVMETERGGESPQRKRQKIEDQIMNEGEEDRSEEPERVSSSPQFREVVIKKKVVVSEYEMNENGEMIVRDVEKMVEEIVREQIKATEKKKPATNSSSASASSNKKKPSSAPAGQGTLMGFFSAKQPKQ